MESILNGTVSAAKNVVESAREGAEHAFGSARQGTEKAVSSTRSVLAEGLHTLGQIVATVRALDRDDALGWVGLSRRRGPLGSMAIFAAGMATGAGVGILFAPVSGAEMRGAIFDRFRGLKGRVASEVKDVEDKAESFVGKVAGAARVAVDEGKPSNSQATQGSMHSPS